MVDIPGLLALGGSATLAAKVLGPTADYIGSGLSSWAEKRVSNLRAVFSNAEAKLGVRLEVAGAVSPRVLKEMLQEASYSEDPVGVEYFGGILASSRTEDGTDDRGAALAKLVAGLSTYVIRSHFVLYAALVGAYDGESVTRSEALGERRIWIDRKEFLAAIGLIDDEDSVQLVESVSAHIFFSLHQFDLLGRSNWNEKLEDDGPLGVTVAPSASGAELFLWALGEGHSMSFASLFGVQDLIPLFDSVVVPKAVKEVDFPSRDSANEGEVV